MSLMSHLSFSITALHGYLFIICLEVWLQDNIRISWSNTFDKILRALTFRTQEFRFLNLCTQQDNVCQLTWHRLLVTVQCNFSLVQSS